MTSIAASERSNPYNLIKGRRNAGLKHVCRTLAMNNVARRPGFLPPPKTFSHIDCGANVRTGSCQKSKNEMKFPLLPFKPPTLAFYTRCGRQSVNTERGNERAYRVGAGAATDCVEGRWEIRSCWSPREGRKIPRVTVRKQSDSKALRGEVPIGV